MSAMSSSSSSTTSPISTVSVASEAKVGGKRKQGDEKDESPIDTKKVKVCESPIDLEETKGRDWFECKCHASVYASPEWYNNHKKQLDESDVKMCRGYACLVCDAESDSDEEESDDEESIHHHAAFYCAKCAKGRFRICPQCRDEDETPASRCLVCDDCWSAHCEFHKSMLQAYLMQYKEFVPPQ